VDSAESLFRRIKRALDEEDIEGLHSIGAPNDEYDGEASLIEDRICKATDFGKKALGLEQLETMIEETWSSQFGPFDQTAVAKRRPSFRRVACKITEAD
jgi:hypothetical protein